MYLKEIKYMYIIYMTIYTCEICKIKTHLKSNYNRHLKTKKHIDNYNKYGNESQKRIKMTTNDHKMTTNPLKMTTNDHKMTTNDHKMTTNFENEKNKNHQDKKFNCEHCNKTFTTKAHLSRHLSKYCRKIKNKKSEYLETMLIEQQKLFDEERKHLYKQIEKLLDKVGDTTINNTQNIQLNNYGNEDLSHITNSFKNQLLKAPYGAIPKKIEAVHFNDEKPENKNISLSNIRDNKIKVFADNKWIYKNKEETINDLVDGKYFILDSHYETRYDEKVNDNLSNFKIVETKYENFRKFYDSGDKELIETLKKECELVLLNNR